MCMRAWYVHAFVCASVCTLLLQVQVCVCACMCVWGGGGGGSGAMNAISQTLPGPEGWPTAVHSVGPNSAGHAVLQHGCFTMPNELGSIHTAGGIGRGRQKVISTHTQKPITETPTLLQRVMLSL